MVEILKEAGVLKLYEAGGHKIRRGGQPFVTIPDTYRINLPEDANDG